MTTKLINLPHLADMVFGAALRDAANNMDLP